MKKTIWSAAVAAAGLMSVSSAFGGLLYEPSNYAAQDNIVVNFDGIRNAGILKAHDSAATEWKNIGRAANNADFFKKDGDASAWVADGYRFAGGAYGKLKFKQNLGNAMTVQIVAEAKGSENSTSWPTFFGCPEDWANIYFSDKSKETLHFKADAITGLSWSNRVSVSSWGGRYLNAALNSSEHKQIITATDSFVTGWKEGPGGSQKAPGSLNWYFGSGGSKQSDLDDRYLVGTIKAIRVYNKVLSDEELAANRAIDEARFFTGIPVTNVVVETAVQGLNGNEGGVFAYDDAGYTFTAPQKATKDGVVYACSGYTLETWNGTAWSAPVSCQSTSCSLSDTTAKYRLVWQWQRAHAEVPVALDPLFDDYVTDGLIMQLDGIRNVGADKPHSWTSPQWHDLVSGSNIASFQHDYADASTWMDDGYYFGGRSFAQFVNTIPKLTNTVTVQVVCDTTTNALLKFKTSANPHVLWPNLVSSADNDQMNVYYDMNGSPRGRLTFKNANGGNVNLANDGAFDSWEGRYATAIRNGNKNYILQTANIADAFSKTAASVTITNGTIRVGGANGSLNSRNQRWFLGLIKAVRIYDRVLTDEELAQNRAIDEARFFGGPMPATNVVVASNIRGVEGNEPEGTYALPAGGHTFSAPATVTVGDDSYSCTGYTLETWDGSAWGTPALHGGVLAAELTDTTAKVRLTWQWTHTAGPGYDAAFSDYVTDGLILHLDGIRNTGAQPAHDSGAIAWADLSTKGGTASFVNNDAATTSGWTADGYYFNGASHAVMNGTRTLDGNYTVQAVLDFDTFASCRDTSAQWPMIVGTTEKSDKLSIYQNQSNRKTPIVACKALNVNPGFALDGWAGDYMTMLFNGSQAALFPEENPTTWKTFSTSPGTRTLTFGGSNGDDSSGAWAYRYLTGTIKAIRIYGRALSNAELSANRAADEVRFFGRPPALTGSLIVASDVAGLSGNQPCGAYRPAAGYTFTSQTNAIVDGVAYELAGYTLETWNGSAWSAADVHDGMHAVAPDVSSASKRLTWNWRIKSRLTKIRDDYDVDDYVQDGLYLHFDGIRNAGKTAAHDNAATTWVNLGTGGTSLNATFDYALDGQPASGWAADGYNFTYGGKFAKIGGSPNLWHTVTIQVVCDVGAGTSSYPHLFGATNDFCNIYAFTAGKRLFFKMFNKGSRPELSPSGSWEGRYANAIWLAGKGAIFQSATPANDIWMDTNWRSDWTQFTGRPFYIGGVYFQASASNTDARRLTGKVQAVRVYKRSLSDAELEQNRKVDEARFKGNPPESNVTIAPGKFDASVEAVGNYKVDGTYTSAEDADVDGKSRRVTGYMVETWNDGTGEWGAPTYHNGASFTYTEGAKVRLTWQWQGEGTVFLFR